MIKCPLITDIFYYISFAKLPKMRSRMKTEYYFIFFKIDLIMSIDSLSCLVLDFLFLRYCNDSNNSSFLVTGFGGVGIISTGDCTGEVYVIVYTDSVETDLTDLDGTYM